MIDIRKAYELAKEYNSGQHLLSCLKYDAPNAGSILLFKFGYDSNYLSGPYMTAVDLSDGKMYNINPFAFKGLLDKCTDITKLVEKYGL